MRLSFVAAAVAVAVITSSCTSYNPAPIPVTGSPVSLAPLAGHWVGDYRGEQTLRTGTIEFNLRASGDSATGSVVMDGNAGTNAIRAADTPEQHRLHSSAPQMLFIRFVGIEGNQVYGKLEPYVAPDCDCVVETGFTGHIRADTVEGTYFTESRLQLTQTGTWRAVRRPVVEQP